MDINDYIILATLFILFAVFLCYDFFRKGETWGFFAYIMATIPCNYLWFAGYDVLGMYVVLFGLWDICLIRDLLLVYQKTKDYDNIFLFLLLAIVVQVMYTAIGPNMNPSMKANCEAWTFFYFPDIYNASFGIESWVNASTLLAFRLTGTVIVLLSILPMLLDLKNSEEHISLVALIIIALIFILPFLWLSFIWLGGAVWVLTPLFVVVLLIVLLLLTRER